MIRINGVRYPKGADLCCGINRVSSSKSQSKPQPNAHLKAQLSSRLGSGKADKEEIILQGALQVFTTQGYSAASMDRIAAAAGVSKSTLYSYFRDKEGLFVALIQSLTQSPHQRFHELPANLDLQSPPEQVLRHMALSMLKEFSQSSLRLTLMRLLIGESEHFPELAKTFIRDVQKPILERLTLYLSAQTQLQLPDPEVAARIFAGSLVHYLIVQHVLHGAELLPLPPERMVAGLVDLITARAT